MKVYLAARYESRALMLIWRDLLVDAGFVVTSRWIEGLHEGMPDRVCADDDLMDVNAASVLIAASPREHFRTGRGGRHVEFGYAIAKGKRLILVGERENVFHHLYDVECVPTIQAAIALLREGPLA